MAPAMGFGGLSDKHGKALLHHTKGGSRGKATLSPCPVCKLARPTCPLVCTAGIKLRKVGRETEETQFLGYTTMHTSWHRDAIYEDIPVAKSAFKEKGKCTFSLKV